MMAAAGAVGGATYVDDVFSTFLYTGNGSSKAIDNGIDLAGEGGMIILKSRDSSDASGSGSPPGYGWGVHDTVRGKTKNIQTQSTAAQATYPSAISSFNSNGFTMGDVTYNYSSQDFVSYSFRKAPGFFDIVTYTGTGSTQSLTHNLKCIPGCIMVKRTDATADWGVYHRGQNGGVDPEDYRLRLNSTTTENNDTYWGDTAPTATHFTVGDAHTEVNAANATYVAYLFAGGESDEPGSARSVDFDGSGDYLSVATSSDLSFGTGDYTIEFWFNADTISDSPLFENRVVGTNNDTTGFTLTAHGSTNGVRIWWNGASRINGGGSKLHTGQWYHLAATRSSGTTYLFLNGELLGTTTDSINLTTTEAHIGGGKYSGGTAISHYYDGKISNVRIIKGTALYTSSFRPPTEGLTNITNTKLLCCNKNTVTGSTVTPGTITSNGNPQSSTDTPFDDPAGFVFGENEDQNVIKCGSYIGNGTDPGPEIFLGWEPSWIMLKRVDSSGDWAIFDIMRGIPTGGSDKYLRPNLSNDAATAGQTIELTPTGFKLRYGQTISNVNNAEMVYVAIRRSDGYVGKPPALGTDVFAIDQGNSSATQMFTSGFPVDFATEKFYTTGSYNWGATSRLTAETYLYLNTTAAEVSYSSFTFDQMDGWGANSSWDSTAISYMWKRHAGFDVVTWSGTNSSVVRRHNLGKTPEMIWFKSRNSTRNWRVYHIGLNGGTNPEDYAINLNQDDPESSNTNYMTSTAPTATHFVSGNDDDTNGSGKTYIAMLFASVDGISKVGYYTGNGSTQTITTGFQPRFVIIRRTDGSEDHWVVLDTTRGWASGDDKVLKLNSTDAQGTSEDMGVPTSTGFSLTSNGWVNYNTGNFIYYAHA